MLKVGVLVSGGGTNLQAIIDRIEDGYLKSCSIATIVSSKPDVYAIERANKQGIPSAVIRRKEYSSLEEYDKSLIEHFNTHNVDLVVMAGFLAMVGPSFLRAFENKIINIHPSLIPSFCGKGYYGIVPHQKALEYGVKITGATVHFVQEEYDSGPVILQKAVYIQEGDTPEILQKRVMEEAEWEILPEAIKLYSEGRLHIDGRKVIISD